MPSRPCFLEVYLISGLVLLLVILQWHLGARRGDLWHHSAGRSPSLHPSARPRVTSLSVSKPVKVRLVCCASCQGLAHACCCCCGSDTTENMGLSTVPGTGSNRKLPSGHLSPGPRGISLIFSFFSPQTCSRGSAP